MGIWVGPVGGAHLVGILGQTFDIYQTMRNNYVLKILSFGIQPSHANFCPFDREHSDSSPESPDGLVVSPDELRRYLFCTTKITGQI